MEHRPYRPVLSTGQARMPTLPKARIPALPNACRSLAYHYRHGFLQKTIAALATRRDSSVPHLAPARFPSSRCCPRHRTQAAAANHKGLRDALTSRQARGKFLCLGQAAGFRKVRTALAAGPARGQHGREGLARGRKQAAALPPARLRGDAQPRAYAGVARGVPGTDQQGSERVHCPASEQNPGADRAAVMAARIVRPLGSQRGIVFPHCGVCGAQPRPRRTCEKTARLAVVKRA